MQTNEQLHTWIEVHSHDIYFRPFVSKSPDSKGNVFIVGINPATPISKDAFSSVEDYIQTLCNRERFIEQIKMIRLSQGKSPLSRTRVGLNQFVKDLEERSGEKIGIIETNMNAYPTKRAKDLLQVKDELIQHGSRVFRELLSLYQPKVIIVHSKQALGELLNLLEAEQMKPSETFKKKIALKDWISKGPITFTYDNGTVGTIFCSKHFMYHGHVGQSFQPLKEQVLAQFEA
ncbi:hypothetical protein [Exiguobacterium chiriqhucha]|uniref:Uracil-DNA glycosylase-like domain-containing protein n=1 Tax=Exiguobacterium chiriqhucha RW-2 TaxID=1345023 RepID=U1LU87_9BACL|nr:hypothetical protein [Exiguobacterium chiriqhucha]ERG65722.1 hypothetical protein M467_00440 [Exiguobacterium chiriqhucha RW-2]